MDEVRKEMKLFVRKIVMVRCSEIGLVDGDRQTG